MTAAVAAAAFVTPALIPAMTAAHAATTTYSGPDVASYQHPATTKYPHGKPINWAQVKAAGKDFAIVKATEGTTYVNPYFNGPDAKDYANSLAAGLVHGSYHFARPATPVVDSAKAQAALFAKTIGNVNTAQTLPPALDLETTGGLSTAQLVTWAQVFLYRLRNLTGRTPMLYTYPYFWSSILDDPKAFSRFPLWMASYGTSVAPVADLWQYTDSATIKGISGKVDVSKYLGTSGLPWSTLSDGTVAAPWKSAAPSAPHHVTVVAGPATTTVSWLPSSDGSARTTSYTVTATPVETAGAAKAKVGGKATTKVATTPSPTTTPTVGPTTTPTATPTSPPATGETGPSGPSVRVSGATTSATITGLDSSKYYTFSVVGSNSVGAGKPSTPSVAIQPIVASALKPATPASLAYGSKLSVAALLTRASTGTPLVSQKVKVYRRELGKTTWVLHSTVKTGSAGYARLTLHPKHSVQVKLKFGGSNGYEPTTSVATTLVHPTVTAALSKTAVKHGHTAKITGTVSPIVTKQNITLELLAANGRWKIVRAKPLATNGSYSFTVRPPHKQKARRFRIIASAILHRSAGVSPTLTLKVT